jgi:hypothetical protein
MNPRGSHRRTEESTLLKLPMIDNLFTRHINWRAGLTPIPIKGIIAGVTDTVHGHGHVIF